MRIFCLIGLLLCASAQVANAQISLTQFFTLTSERTSAQIHLEPSFSLFRTESDLEPYWVGRFASGEVRCPLGAWIEVKFNPIASGNFTVTEMRATFNDDLTQPDKWPEARPDGSRFGTRLHLRDVGVASIKVAARIKKGDSKRTTLFIFQIRQQRSTAKYNQSFSVTVSRVRRLDVQTPVEKWQLATMRLGSSGVITDVDIDELVEPDETDANTRLVAAPIPMPPGESVTPRVAAPMDTRFVEVKIKILSKTRRQLASKYQFIAYRTFVGGNANRNASIRDLPKGLDSEDGLSITLKFPAEEAEKTWLELFVQDDDDTTVGSLGKWLIINARGGALKVTL